MSRRGLVLAGLVVVLPATGCSSGDGGTAGETPTDASSGETALPAADLEGCAAIAAAVDACYAEAFSALMRDADDPGPTLEEIAVAAYTDSSVLTNGEFERYGCGSVPSPRSRRACVEGAGEVDEPLVTFS